MSRILEFSPSNEEAVVSRILVLVHQTVDDYFPSALQANRQFTKTVFSEEGENTALSSPGAQFAFNEDTSPDREIPPPPPAARSDVRLPATPSESERTGGRIGEKTGERLGAAASSARPKPAKDGKSDKLESPAQKPAAAAFTDIKSLHASQMTQLGDSVEDDGPDWTTRITIAMLIAGLVMLAYVLIAPAG